MSVEEEVDAWLEEHFDEEEDIHTFQPQELGFCLTKFDDDEPVAIITPLFVFENEHACYDQSFLVPGFDWDEVCEGMFLPEGENPRQFLLDLGMKEVSELGQLGLGY